MKDIGFAGIVCHRSLCQNFIFRQSILSFIEHQWACSEPRRRIYWYKRHAPKHNPLDYDFLSEGQDNDYDGNEEENHHAVTKPTQEGLKQTELATFMVLSPKPLTTTSLVLTPHKDFLQLIRTERRRLDMKIPGESTQINIRILRETTCFQTDFDVDGRFDMGTVHSRTNGEPDKLETIVGL